MTYEIQLREVGPQTILGVRAIIFTHELVAFFDKVVSEMRECVATAGSPRSFWHSAPGEIPDASDVETCLPIEHPVPASGRIQCQTLAAGLQAFTVHEGD